MNNGNSKDEAQGGFAAWEWPMMDSPISQPESNALGYAPNWYQEEQTPDEPLVEPEPEQAPLTLEEIEAIRQAAYDDGFAEGRQAGYEQGHDEGRQQGLLEGHAEGVAQGHQEGLQQGQAEVDASIAHWQQLAEQLVTPLAQLDQQVEQQLVYLAMQLAKALIQHETHTAPDLLLNSLKEAVRLLPCAEEGITLQLHPDDIARLHAAFGAEECQRRGWTLQAEPTLQPGDLQLLSRTSSIDWVLEERISQLLRNFLRQNIDRERPV